MALILADRVRETSTTTGTGTLTLDGAVTSYQSFAAVGNANTTYYAIVNQNAAEWEVGIGTYTSSGTTLSRDTVLSSSNSGSLVNFSAGTKDVWGDYPAGKAVTTDTLAYPPAIGGTTAAAGTFTTLTATGQTSLGGVAGSESLRVLTPVSTGGYLQVQSTSATQSSIQTVGSANDYNFGISSKGTGAIRFFTAALATEQFRVFPTASAVNYVQVTGNITNNAPSVISAGSDGSVGLSLSSKSTGTVSVYSNSANSNSRHLDITHTGSVVNRFQLTGAITGNGVTLGVNGSDANISQVFQPKGTGAIDLAAGSSGVNISNGGTVTAITRTAAGTLYTSFPTWTASAPTTAGGATASGSVGSASATGTATVVSGGTGYTNGDILTPVGGTGGSATRITVSAVSGGVITAASVTANSEYTVLPTNPVSVTGGTGSGATFNLTYSVGAIFTISNAGSGYVEQPTVTFSGGGGSGAAAYATVGSDTTIKSLGASLFLSHPNGVGLQVKDAATGGTPAYPLFQSSGTTVQIFASGTNASVGFQSATKGATNHSFATNSSVANEQMRVSHTASAVNYVQVTGAGAGNPPVISSQGATTPDLDLTLTPKGAGRVNITTSIKPKVNSTTSVASPLAWNSTSYDEYALTALANALTISADANTAPADGQRMMFRFKDNGTAQTLTWTTGSARAFRVVGVTLPTTTVANKLLYVGCIYNAADSRWDAIAVGQEA